VYGWVWRKLPGPWPVRTLEALGLFFAVCALLVVVVFPWVEPQLPFSDNVVDGSGTSPEATDPAATAPAAPTPSLPTPGTGDGSGPLPGDG
jgi:hypothetical protein